jgi:hypothetical protein
MVPRHAGLAHSPYRDCQSTARERSRLRSLPPQPAPAYEAVQRLVAQALSPRLGLVIFFVADYQGFHPWLFSVAPFGAPTTIAARTPASCSGVNLELSGLQRRLPPRLGGKAVRRTKTAFVARKLRSSHGVPFCRRRSGKCEILKCLVRWTIGNTSFVRRTKILSSQVG